MGGPNLEVFKFGCYVFFPILAMLKFGDPEWYENYVIPYKEAFWPPYETTNRPPKTSTELQDELARMKAARQARRTTQIPMNNETTSTLTPSNETGVISPGSRGARIGDLQSSAGMRGSVQDGLLRNGVDWNWAKDSDRRLV